jgi:hypothetical protein
LYIGKQFRNRKFPSAIEKFWVILFVLTIDAKTSEEARKDRESFFL